MSGAWRAALILCACVLALAAQGRAVAQVPQPPAAPTAPPAATPNAPAPNAPAPSTPDGQPPPAAQPGTTPGSQPSLPPDIAEVTAEEARINGSVIHARNVRVHVGEYDLSAERLDGDFNRELVLTGNPVISFRGQLLTGDAIYYTPKTRLFRIENAHTALTPDFLQGRLTSPLYIRAGELTGSAGGELTARAADTTTCDHPRPDYDLLARELTVQPGREVVLRNVGIVLWGKRLLTLPALIIPLNRPRGGFHADYLPRVGESADEGWFAKSAFNYFLANRAPGLLRLDLMQKKGIGLGVDQRWILAGIIGGLTLYAIPTGSTNRNLSGSLNNQFRLGAGQTVSLNTDFQKNSYLAVPETTSLSARVGYALATSDVTTNLSLGHTSTSSSGYSTDGLTASLAQTFRLGSNLSWSLGSDYSGNSTSSLGGTSAILQRTDQLSARTQVDYRAPNYSLQLVANGSIPIGAGTGQSYFSGVEKLPEITLSNYRFTQGPLSKLPLTVMMSAGQYSEPGTTFTTSGGSSSVVTERLVAGFDMQDTRMALSRSTDLSVAGGFQQYLYGDGAAQFMVRTHALLTQMLYRESGIRLDYSYQQPEGGSPFHFDQLGQFHTLTGDVGLLGDKRLQLTARVGYNLANTTFGGISMPWQTLSANLLVRPTNWSRLQDLVSFDPNTGKVLSVTTDMRFRGGNALAVDLVSRYDPAQHTFGNFNGYLNIPIGRDWRVISLFQYNGYLSQFESRNIQIVRDLHCMEAELTYSENPFGYRADRQIFFQLRIKAFPIFQRFGVGQTGQAIDTSIGGLQ